MKCEMCDFSKEIQHKIFETTYWVVNISNNQGYLGRSVVILKRHAGDLIELKPAEWKDLMKLIKKMEAALRKSFGATMFNWTCLMNNAYKKNPPNPHVHLHFIPRYNHKVKFGDIMFEDPEFAHFFNRERKISVSADVEQQIISKIKETWGV